MAYNQQKETNWINKEKRDMIFRAILSDRINNPDFDWEKTFNEFVKVLERVFEQYPDEIEGTVKQIDIDFPEK